MGDIVAVVEVVVVVVVVVVVAVVVVVCIVLCRVALCNKDLNNMESIFCNNWLKKGTRWVAVRPHSPLIQSRRLTRCDPELQYE